MTDIAPFLERTIRLLRELTEGKADVRSFDADVGVTGDPTVMSTKTGLGMTVFALNLLARTFKRVFLLPPIGTNYLTSTYREFERVWGFPWTAIHAGLVQPGSHADAVLAIGGGTPQNQVTTITIGCDGWVAEYRRGAGLVSVSDDPNPIGPAVAVSLGVAQVFGALAGRGLPSGLRQRFEGPQSLRWSAYSYKDEDNVGPAASGNLDLQDVVFVGLGGVGTAISAVLAACPSLTGRILLIDPDRIAESNLNRFLSATQDDVGRQKTDVVQKHLARHQPKLQVLSVPLAYHRAIRQLGRPSGLVISTVDTEPLRAFIQSDLPRVIIDAATSGPVVGVSRHTFIDGACLGCLHPRSGEPFASELQMARLLGQPLSFVIDRLADDQPLAPQELRALAERLGLDVQFSLGKPLRVFWAEDVCGKVDIPDAAVPEPTSGSAAFISALAGAFAAGEVLKSVMQTNPLENELKIQVFKGPNHEFPRKRAKDPKCSCFCSDASMQEAFRERHHRITPETD